MGGGDSGGDSGDSGGSSSPDSGPSEPDSQGDQGDGAERDRDDDKRKNRRSVDHLQVAILAEFMDRIADEVFESHLARENHEAPEARWTEIEAGEERSPLGPARALETEGKLDEAAKAVQGLLKFGTDSLALHRLRQDIAIARGKTRALVNEYRQRAKADDAAARYLYSRLLEGKGAVSALEEFHRIWVEFLLVHQV